MSLIGNPAPAHNGRTCVGPDRLEMYCSNLPPCPEPRPTPIDGGWGPFGTWSKCTALCGGGYRFRRRLCDSPFPQNGGLECNGCDIDYEICNAQKCPERNIQGPWTPWLQFSNLTSTGERMEKRFRYFCKFNATDGRVYKAKEENRVCLDRTCRRVDEDSNNWSLTEPASRTSCTTNCSINQQARYAEKKTASHEGLFSINLSFYFILEHSTIFFYRRRSCNIWKYLYTHFDFSHRAALSVKYSRIRLYEEKIFNYTAIEKYWITML